MLDGDPVDLHDVVADPEAAAARWGVGQAVIHQEGAVSHDGEAETAVGAWVDVHLGNSQIRIRCEDNKVSI